MKPMREEDTSEYWDRKWSLREQRSQERVTLEGSDGETEFDRDLHAQSKRKEVLDTGCGPGEFALSIAKIAKRVVGIDISATALKLAKENLRESKLTNVEFRHANIRRIPFPEDSFDLVYSRRGPASEDIHNLSEVHRVLRNGGTFVEITIGERDKQNIAMIFGRGQMYQFKGQVSLVKKEWLKKAGFSKVVSRDYLGTEVFQSLSDLVTRLKSAPIIPSFDAAKDKKYLERVAKECTTENGIETQVHRVVLLARK